MMTAIVALPELLWRRRTRGVKRAHLFVNGAPACGYALVAGSPFVDCELTSRGLPSAVLCDSCSRAALALSTSQQSPKPPKEIP